MTLQSSMGSWELSSIEDEYLSNVTVAEIGGNVLKSYSGYF